MSEDRVARGNDAIGVIVQIGQGHESVRGTRSGRKRCHRTEELRAVVDRAIRVAIEHEPRRTGSDPVGVDRDPTSGEIEFS